MYRAVKNNKIETASIYYENLTVELLETRLNTNNHIYVRSNNLTVIKALLLPTTESKLVRKTIPALQPGQKQ